MFGAMGDAPPVRDFERVGDLAVYRSSRDTAQARLREYHHLMSRQEVLSTLQAQRTALHERFGVARLTLFGSVARDEGGKGSDVDLLVEFDRPVGLFSFLELQHHLEVLLGCAVDLGTPQSLKPRLRARVMSEAVHVV